MGKPRHGKPDRFGEGGGFSTAIEPVEDVELVAAIDRFVQAYVIEEKRPRVHGKLIGPKRGDTLRGLHAVIDAKYSTDLEGNAGFPQHVQERFGDMRGILVAEFAAFKMTIAGAVYKAHLDLNESCLFVSSALAMFIPEVGDPTLLRRQLVAK